MFGGGLPSVSKSESPEQDSRINISEESTGIHGNLQSIGEGKRSHGSKNTIQAPGKYVSHKPDFDKISLVSTYTSESTPKTDNRQSGNSASTSGPPEQQKKHHSSGVSSRASNLLATAKNTFTFSQAGRLSHEGSLVNQPSLQKLCRRDTALAMPQGSNNNSAGESIPGPRSSFRVGVWEDRNKKCRRTMEDTHAFLYNFLRIHTMNLTGGDIGTMRSKTPMHIESEATDTISTVEDVLETDNGYFAIFDGHAGTMAADWCGKKLHLILEDTIRRNPNVPIPELLDQTFTSVDSQLEKLPIKNSGCTAAVAILRWEDRVTSYNSTTSIHGISSTIATKSTEAIFTADRKHGHAVNTAIGGTTTSATETETQVSHPKLNPILTRQRVLYTANVGDARIVLCRSGKALRLSYDHKGSDDNEGRRITNAGGLILNNRVNGVLAVTRALGDTYIKDLVTGHPYTTETVIQSDVDEFLIIACDGLWDVCSDQDAVNLVRGEQDPVAAAKMLVDHALSHFSTDNLSCMIVRLENYVTTESILKSKDYTYLAPSNTEKWSDTTSKADAVITRKAKDEDGSASSCGRGHGPISNEEMFTPTTIKESVQE